MDVVKKDETKTERGEKEANGQNGPNEEKESESLDSHLIIYSFMCSIMFATTCFSFIIAYYVV